MVPQISHGDARNEDHGGGDPSFEFPPVDPVVRLHIGAHKTATTYIQEMLLANRTKSAARGYAYWPLSTVRPAIRRALGSRKRARLSGWKAALNGDMKAVRRARRALRNWFAHGLATTISEENIIGNPQNCYGSTLYPEAGRRLRFIGEALPELPVELYFCIRSYPDFLASIYGEALRHGNFLPIEEFKAAHAAPGGQWSRLIDAVLKAMPNANLIIWPYEAFGKLEPTILERLSGVEYSRLTRLPYSTVLRSATAGAIDAMMDVAPSISWQERVFTMLALQNKYPPGSQSRRFDPWTEEERARMRDAYESELEVIARRKDLTFLS